MIFHATQKIVAADNHQFRVVNCGRQWGKTTLAVWEMFVCAISGNDKEVTYYATTFDQARDIAWNLLKSIAKDSLYSEPNESRLELSVKTVHGGRSRIKLRSWESVERARGTQNDLLVLDEVSKMRNFKEGWQGALLATLAFRQGKALFISTPYGFNHFYDLHQLGQGQDPNWKSWTFTSFDNPYLPKEYLAGIQATVTSDFWAQEYLAEFRRFTGLVYKEFDITKHVHEFEHEINSHGEYIFGQDFAVRGWTAMLPYVLKSTGDFYILDNYKEEGLTAQVHAENEKETLKKYANLDMWVGYADPSGFARNQQKGEMMWAIADEYLEAGLPIVRANNEVDAGINYVRQLFRTDKIHIHPRCTQLVDELLQYQWKTQGDTRVGEEDAPERVRKINDHLVDCMRYGIYSKPIPPEEEQLPSKSVFPIKFPEPKIEKEERIDEYTEIESGTDIYS